jgi:hypothetical protein
MGRHRQNGGTEVGMSGVDNKTELLGGNVIGGKDSLSSAD